MEGSSDPNAGDSSLTWWEEKGRLSGRRDRVTVVKKKCRAFKADRHPDEHEVMFLGARAVQVSLPRFSLMGMGTMCGVGRDVLESGRPGTRIALAGSKPRCRGGGGSGSVGRRDYESRAARVDASAVRQP